MAAAVSILALLLVLELSGWFFHIGHKNITTERLKQDIKDRDATISMLNDRLNRLSSERVPLRSRCRCGHDAYRHDSRGCQKEGLIFGCGCFATQEQVLYDPEPMRKMLPL